MRREERAAPSRSRAPGSGANRNEVEGAGVAPGLGGPAKGREGTGAPPGDDGNGDLRRVATVTTATTRTRTRMR
jgi:hypothetical protein